MTRDADSPGHPPPQGQILIYQDQATRLQVRLEGRTVWLTQAGMAELYQTTPQNITIHLKGIYEDEALGEQATFKEFLQVRVEGDPPSAHSGLGPTTRNVSACFAGRSGRGRLQVCE